MKFYKILLAVSSFIFFFSCKKTGESSVFKNEVNKETVSPCPTCPPRNGGGGNNTGFTDEELQAMGQNVGCQLATAIGTAPLVSYYTGPNNTVPVYNQYYQSYLNTTSPSYNAPTVYKDGVQYGWISCYSHGYAVTPCGNTTISYVNPDGIVSSMNMCQWWSQLGLPIIQ